MLFPRVEGRWGLREEESVAYNILPCNIVLAGGGVRGPESLRLI